MRPRCRMRFPWAELNSSWRTIPLLPCEQGVAMEGTASKPRSPRLGDVLEPEVLATYLKQRRGTLAPYRDRITVSNGFSEERFDLVRGQAALDFAWARTTCSIYPLIKRNPHNLLKAPSPARFNHMVYPLVNQEVSHEKPEA